MTLPIVAIVIGVSLYKEESIAPLPAAQNDALHFARAIKNWGVPEESISLFLNAGASQKAIEEFFDQLGKKQEPYKLLFYFCGHGYRMPSSEAPQSYLLLHDSYIQKKQCCNSLNLDLMIQAVGRLNAVESYVFIDACHLRVNAIMNPRLEEELRGNETSHKSLFCLLSSGIQESYESEKGQYGYFTEALLKGFCKIRRSEGSPTQLLHLIRQEMTSEGLHHPEMCNFGNQKISFLTHSEISFDKEFVYRYEVIGKIQDAWVENREKKVCLIGEPGVGKSAIAQYFESEKLKTIYIAMPSSIGEDFNPVDYLANGIKEKLKNDFSEDLSPQQVLMRLDEFFSFYLILVDQLEHLPAPKLNEFCEKIVCLKTQVLLLFTSSAKGLIDERFLSGFVEVEVPPFSLEESEQLIKMLDPNSSDKERQLVYLISQGNPLKMKKIVFSFSKTTNLQSSDLEKELKKIIAAVYSCGSYINEQLFVKQFNLQTAALDFLKEIGFISYLENRWTPHPFLQEMAEVEKLSVNPQATLNYWYEQLDELPGHIQASQSLIFSIQNFGYEKKAEKYLKNAIQALYFEGKKNLRFMIHATEIFLSFSHLTETAFFLAGILIDWGQFDWAEQLLSKQPVNDRLTSQVKLLRAQKHWRILELKESIALCSDVIQEAKASSLLPKAYFHRGIAYFLNGSWAEASADFTFVYKNAQDKHYVGRAQCMLGTVIGIQRAHFQLGQKHLEEGVRLLLKIKDFEGVWTGWNNLGEMFWRSGEFKASAFYLEKALELTPSLNQESARLETLRNLLQLHLRLSGPLSKKATELILEMERFDWHQCAIYEQIQVLNALCTAYILRKNVKKSSQFLKLLIPLTLKHGEHHYTLSNLALFFRLLGNNEKAESFSNEAIQLAQKKNNLLAIQQMKIDFARDGYTQPISKGGFWPA